jgi:formylglycine-generating enzyme required for sulfatase activity
MKFTTRILVKRKKLNIAVFISGLTISLLLYGCSDKGTNSNKSPTNGNPYNFTPNGMKLITGGIFLMGSNNGDSTEQPVHSVTVSSFWMDSTEVTQEDYEKLTGGSPWVNYTHTYFGGISASRPAWNVNWCNTVLYCNARSKRDGFDTVYSYTALTGSADNYCRLTELAIDTSKRGYRLPTEAEWEYACRTLSSTDYYWGKDYNPYPETSLDTAEIDSHAVWRANSSDLGESHPDYGTHPVATKLPNAFGLYDMIGNVFEWCLDRYRSDYYSTSPQINPFYSDSSSGYVIRGYRGWHSENRSYIGFRCVLPAQ